MQLFWVFWSHIVLCVEQAGGHYKNNFDFNSALYNSFIVFHENSYLFQMT